MCDNLLSHNLARVEEGLKEVTEVVKAILRGLGVVEQILGHLESMSEGQLGLSVVGCLVMVGSFFFMRAAMKRLVRQAIREEFGADIDDIKEQVGSIKKAITPGPVEYCDECGFELFACSCSAFEEDAHGASAPNPSQDGEGDHGAGLYPSLNGLDGDGKDEDVPDVVVSHADGSLSSVA